ncbi:hypothetical protein [Bradyrhizobium sp.]|uniref:hypothetical protein n=1 Tax=Bradyrhizobium sp. TaxID=376 RepID=UPI004037E9B6
MRNAVLTLSTLAVLLAAGVPVLAQSCKDCAEQQKACMKNYAGPACKSEYQICIKSCKK